VRAPTIMSKYDLLWEYFKTKYKNGAGKTLIVMLRKR